MRVTRVLASRWARIGLLALTILGAGVVTYDFASQGRTLSAVGVALIGILALLIVKAVLEMLTSVAALNRRLAIASAEVERFVSVVGTLAGGQSEITVALDNHLEDHSDCRDRLAAIESDRITIALDLQRNATQVANVNEELADIRRQIGADGT